MFSKASFTRLLITVGVGVLLVVLWFQSDIPEESRKLQPVEPQESTEKGSPLLIKLFNYKKVDEYGLNSIVTADLLEVRPRRFMVFNAKTVNEAVLRNAHIVLHTYEHKEPADDFSDIFDYECPPPCIGNSTTNSARIRPLGRVTRLVADKISIELYRDDQKILGLEAATGLIKKKKEDVQFFDATLKDARSHRFIQSRKILWDTKRNVFVIPGHYSDTDTFGSVTGAQVEVNMDFKVTHLVRP